MNSSFSCLPKPLCHHARLSNFSWHPNFLKTVHRTLWLTMSKAFLRLVYIYKLFTTFFFWICLDTIFTTPLLFWNLYCDSERVLFATYLFIRFRNAPASILPPRTKRRISILHEILEIYQISLLLYNGMMISFFYNWCRK